MPPAARLTDMHVCPLVTGVVPHVGGPIVAPGAPTVMIEFMPAARMTDMAVCTGPPDMIMMGSPTVLIEFLMAARMGDPTVHGGVIVLGAPTVQIGEAGMGSPSMVMVMPPAGGGGGGGGGSANPASGPAETQGKGITAGASRTDNWTPGQLVVAQDGIVMQMAAQAIQSAAAQALASTSQNGTPFIEPCPGCEGLTNAAGPADSSQAAPTPNQPAPTSSVAPGDLVVSVTDATDGSAIGGATVQISGPQAQTATSVADGTATFPGIPAGNYSITGSKAGYLPASGTATVASAATNTATITLQLVHAALLIKEVTFTGNHVVEQDTLGNFPSPEWVEGRAQQSPVCYTQNVTPQLTAKFRVTTHPSATEAVQVRGTATLGATTLQWVGSVNVAPGDNEVTTPTLTSSSPLPGQIACFDPANFTWEFNPAGTGWASGGTSSNILYVTLGDPSGTPAYWTLLDISCRAASGDTVATTAVRHFFVPFGGRNLQRKRDGHALTYWNPNTTTCTNTALLLAAADGSGQCGSWAEFFIDMCKAHGITGADKVVIIRSVAASSTTGFLVKNWRFNHPPASSATAFTHDMYTQCVKLPGIPGQNNPNPPPAFYNHFIVLYDGVFFDPSYGAGPFATQIDWEAAAIDGLFYNPTTKAGYDKSLNSAVKLLEFWDMVTNAKL